MAWTLDEVHVPFSEPMAQGTRVATPCGPTRSPGMIPARKPPTRLQRSPMLLQPDGTAREGNRAGEEPRRGPIAGVRVGGS